MCKKKSWKFIVGGSLQSKRFLKHTHIRGSAQKEGHVRTVSVRMYSRLKEHPQLNFALRPSSSSKKSTDMCRKGGQIWLWSTLEGGNLRFARRPFFAKGIKDQVCPSQPSHTWAICQNLPFSFEQWQWLENWLLRQSMGHSSNQNKHFYFQQKSTWFNSPHIIVVITMMMLMLKVLHRPRRNGAPNCGIIFCLLLALLILVLWVYAGRLQTNKV